MIFFFFGLFFFYFFPRIGKKGVSNPGHPIQNIHLILKVDTDPILGKRLAESASGLDLLFSRGLGSTYLGLGSTYLYHSGTPPYPSCAVYICVAEI